MQTEVLTTRKQIMYVHNLQLLMGHYSQSHQPRLLRKENESPHMHPDNVGFHSYVLASFYLQHYL